MKDIKKILLPIDFSEASPMLLRYAIYFAEKYDAKILVVSVVEDPYTLSGLPSEVPLLDIFDDESRESLAQYTQKRMERFFEDNISQLGVACDSVILTGHPAEEIINYAARERSDLIIIGTHGYKGFDKMLFGSVAEKVIKMSPCPVLIINTYKQK